MNSFSFLIAFVAACTLPIAYGSPCMGLDTLDCGSSSGSGLMGGQIVSAGRMVQANSWSNAATIDTGAGCNTGAAVVNAMPIAAPCNTVDVAPASDCLDNAGYISGYGSGYGSGWGSGYGSGYSGYNTGYASDCGDYMPAAVEPCNEPQPPRMLVSQQRNPIVVNRPATNVVVNQPADIVKANPVVIKRPPGVVVRPIIKNVYPRPVKVQPVIVRAIRPVEKHFVKKSFEDCAGPVWSHTKVVPDC